MANRRNTTTGKDWRRRTLRFGLDDFRGVKVIIFVQLDHWNTRSQETASSSVNSSRNAEAPDKRISNYPKKKQRNLDIFAWKPTDMIGVPRHIAECRLNVREGCYPVRQKKRGQAADRNQAIQEEVGKFWRMCVDFKDLNKACPKDGYPLPEIDWKVESLATYQRLVGKAFCKQIGRNLEVYVDDLVIKSGTEDEIVRDIEETFKTLREINLKLNPKKCTFGVEEGMFLGYKFNTKGLKVCPDKVDAILSLPSLKWLKDVKKLNGKLASLNRFLAKSAEKSLPFFKTLKKCTKKSDFHWTTEAEEVFKQMKQLIAELPMLTAPMEKEELIVYLVVTKKRKVSDGLGTYKQALKEILSSTSNHSNHRSTDTAVSVKGKILADFIVERPKEDSQNTLMEVEEELPKPWISFTDGSSCTDGSGAGLILTNPEGMEFTYALRFMFDATNNEAETTLSEVCPERDTRRILQHAFTRSNMAKALRIGYYWPTMHKDARPFPEEQGKVKFLIVAIDYFTKWIEAKPVATITRNQIKKFMRDNIVCRFGLSGEIISDNGKQFRDNPFKDWCEKLCIRQHFAFVKHPQTNGLVERANCSLGEGIKEKREQAAIREAKSKAKMEKYYNSNVLSASFKIGDLVYRNNDASRAKDIRKLGPKWEGPYEITKALGKGAYKLRNHDGKQLP
nr:reverse transcriptase domain-containing protein [Tanacetum cinerariifolium]